MLVRDGKMSGFNWGVNTESARSLSEMVCCFIGSGLFKLNPQDVYAGRMPQQDAIIWHIRSFVKRLRPVKCTGETGKTEKELGPTGHQTCLKFPKCGKVFSIQYVLQTAKI